MGRLLVLVGGTLAFWVVVAVPVRHLGGGDQAMISSATAVLLCLVPAALTLAVAEWSLRGDPDQVILVTLGGTGVRMLGVFLGGFLLTRLFPIYRDDPYFWTWLLVAYLFTLALEVGLVLTAVRVRTMDRGRGDRAGA
jgi:hypothetical protein